MRGSMSCWCMDEIAATLIEGIRTAVLLCKYDTIQQCVFNVQ